MIILFNVDVVPFVGLNPHRVGMRTSVDITGEFQFSSHSIEINLGNSVTVLVIAVNSSVSLEGHNAGPARTEGVDLQVKTHIEEGAPALNGPQQIIPHHNSRQT